MRNRDWSWRSMRWGMLAAYALHLLIVGLFIFGVIPQEYHPADRLFWLHNGGDNVGYYDLAHDLYAWDFHPSKYPLGFPILLLPFVWLFPHYRQDQLMEVVAAFWGLVMFPVGQWALAWLAGRLTGRRRLALLAVLIWTALPLVFYLLLRLVASPVVAETGSVHLTWVQMLSDGPAALFTLLVMIAFLRLRDAAHRNAAHYNAGHEGRWALALGALGGFLALIRLTGGLAVGVVGVLLLLERRWRAVLLMAAGALIVFAPQMVYNWHFFGGPLTTGYEVLDTLPPLGLFHPAYLGEALGKMWARMGVLLPLAVLAALAAGGAGLAFLWRRDRIGVLAVGLWVAGYLAVYSIYYYSWTGGLFRFLIPVYPAGAILAAALFGLVAERIARAGGSGPALSSTPGVDLRSPSPAGPSDRAAPP